MLGGNPICFLSVFSGLHDCYYCSNIIISLFSSFVTSLASDCKKFKSCDMLSRNTFCLLDGKIPHKSPDHLFDLNCFDSMIHTITFRAFPLSFLIWVAEVFLKNYLLSAIMFFTNSAPFYLFLILQTLSLLFLCKNFWAI